jgi:hypothetical protein
MNATRNKQTIWTSPTERFSPISNMNRVNQHRHRESGSAIDALELDGATASSAIVTDDDQEEPENPTCSTPRYDVSSEARSSALQTLTLIRSWESHQGPTHGPQSLLSTVAEQLAEQTSSDFEYLLDIEGELQNTKRRLTKQNILTLGICSYGKLEIPFCSARTLTKLHILQLQHRKSFHHDLGNGWLSTRVRSNPRDSPIVVCRLFPLLILRS